MQHHVKAEPRQAELHEAVVKPCYDAKQQQQHHNARNNVAHLVAISHENRPSFVDILQRMVFMEHQRLAEKVLYDRART